MDRSEVRRAWERVSERYASSRNADGPDAALIDDLLDSLPSDPEPLVLDIGCGDGERTLKNLPRGAVGLDFARRGLELAAAGHPDARLVQGEMSAIPLRADSVDAITAYHAVFHVPRTDQPAVYGEFARVLEPGGRLLMTLPAGEYETVRRGWMGGPMFFASPGRAATLRSLEAAGFGIDRTERTDDPLGSETEFVFATLSDGKTV